MYDRFVKTSKVTGDRKQTMCYVVEHMRSPFRFNVFYSGHPLRPLRFSFSQNLLHRKIRYPLGTHDDTKDDPPVCEPGCVREPHRT